MVEVPKERRLAGTMIFSSRGIDRIAGLALLQYLVAVAVVVATRVAVDTDAGGFREALQAIGDQRRLFLVNLSADLVSAILLVGVAGALCLALGRAERSLALAGAFFLLAAGLAWVVASAAGFALASLASEYMAASQPQADLVAAGARGFALLREFTGKTGFTLAALGALKFGGLIAWSGVLPRWLGWLGIITGVMMLFIWYDGGALLHRLGGSGYMLWLLLTGGWLIIKGTRPGAIS